MTSPKDQRPLDGPALDAVLDALPEAAPAESGRGRLMKRIARAPQFPDAAPAIAAHFGWTDAMAESALVAARGPFVYPVGEGVGIRLLGDAPVAPPGFAAIFRLAAGATLAPHRHVGEERLYVLQGRCLDTSSGKELGPGTRGAGADGHLHAFEVLPGPPMVYVATSVGGFLWEAGGVLDFEAIRSA